MVVCLCVVPLWYTGNLYTVYPTFRQSDLCDSKLAKWWKKWVDGTHFHVNLDQIKQKKKKKSQLTKTLLQTICISKDGAKTLWTKTL